MTKIKKPIEKIADILFLIMLTTCVAAAYFFIYDQLSSKSPLDFFWMSLPLIFSKCILITLFFGLIVSCFFCVLSLTNYYNESTLMNGFEKAYAAILLITIPLLLSNSEKIAGFFNIDIEPISLLFFNVALLLFLVCFIAAIIFVLNLIYDPEKTLPEELKNLMATHQISVIELSEETGIKGSILKGLLSGKNRNPRVKTLKRIANYFDVSMTSLIEKV